VYTPKFIPGLTVTIDLFDIESTGRVNSTPNPDDIVLRDLEGRSLPGETVFRDANGNVISIEGTYQNGGSQKARGADFGIQYQRETHYGTFTSLTQATYLDSFQFAGTPDVPEKEFRGSGSPFGLFSAEGYLKWKGNSRLDWAWKGFDLAGTVFYRDGFHEHLNFGPMFPDNKKEHWVHQTFFVDGQASYDFSFAAPVETKPVAGYSKGTAEMELGKDGKPVALAAEQTASYGLPAWKRILSGTTLTIGCNNIFGQDPPNSGNGYPTFSYDPTGRFVYLSLKKKF
nr:TonB-dependent receptor [Chthoniobacterales bacterium]